MKTMLPAVALVAAAVSCPAQVHLLDPAAEIDLIAFGSCARQDREQPVFDEIAAEGADVFLFIGDNTYCDLGGDVPENRAEIEQAWQALGAKERWQRFTRSQPVLATWDDHDYGKNDAGVEWALKNDARELFLDFFGERSDSPRRTRDGIYDAITVGPEGRRVQIILLDTRWNRGPLTENPAGRVGGLGPYIAGADTSAAVLGEAQWDWLEERLREPADVRILASSIQVVADEHGWETWGNFPHERERLYRLIDETDAAGVIVISGDRHLMELSRDAERGAPYPIYDFTSSGLNWEDKPHTVPEPNARRIAGPAALRQVNYGLIRIRWARERTTIELVGKGPDGEAIIAHTVGLGELRERP
jgi:alkaline phosphatase D